MQFQRASFRAKAFRIKAINLSNSSIIKIINQIIHKKFEDAFRIENLLQNIWMVYVEESSGLHGFSFDIHNNEINIYDQLSVYMLWVSELVANLIAYELKTNIIISAAPDLQGKVKAPDPDPINNFLDWMKIGAPNEDLDKLIRYYLQEVNKLPKILQKNEPYIGIF